MCSLGVSLHIYLKDVSYLGISLHICLKDMYTGYFAAHLSERYASWQCSHTSMGNIGLLRYLCEIGWRGVYWVCPVYAHLSWKCVQWMFFNPSLWNISIPGIYLHSYPKDVSAACFLHICLKDVCNGYFPTRLCELSISHKSVYSGHFAAHLS